ARRGVLAPALYRLKWAELLSGHRDRAVVQPAMRDGLMAVMLELAGRPEAEELMPRLQAAFRQWGGTRFYVTPPPRHPLKRLVAQTLLDVGGPALLKAVLSRTAQLRRNNEPLFSRFQAPANDGDRRDAAIIAEVIGR